MDGPCLAPVPGQLRATSHRIWSASRPPKPAVSGARGRCESSCHLAADQSPGTQRPARRQRRHSIPIAPHHLSGGLAQRDLLTTGRGQRHRERQHGRAAPASQKTLCTTMESSAAESVYQTPHRSWPDALVPVASDKPRWTEPPPRCWRAGLLGNVSLRGLVAQRCEACESCWRRGVGTWLGLAGPGRGKFDVRGGVGDACEARGWAAGASRSGCCAQKQQTMVEDEVLLAVTADPGNARCRRGGQRVGPAALRWCTSAPGGSGGSKRHRCLPRV